MAVEMQWNCCVKFRFHQPAACMLAPPVLFHTYNFCSFCNLFYNFSVISTTIMTHYILKLIRQQLGHMNILSYVQKLQRIDERTNSSYISSVRS